MDCKVNFPLFFCKYVRQLLILFNDLRDQIWRQWLYLALQLICNMQGNFDRKRKRYQNGKQKTVNQGSNKLNNKVVHGQKPLILRFRFNLGKQKILQLNSSNFSNLFLLPEMVGYFVILHPKANTVTITDETIDI